MAVLKLHDVKDYTITVGPYLLSGFGESEAVSIEYDENLFETQSGVDGEITRAKKHVNTAMVTIKLMQNSNSCKDLFGLAVVDNAANIAPYPVSVINVKTGVSYVAAQAWLEKWPNETAAGEIQELEWGFKCADLVITRA